MSNEDTPQFARYSVDQSNCTVLARSSQDILSRAKGNRTVELRTPSCLSRFDSPAFYPGIRNG